jgi:8-oxo-dGTP diphosphatase
MAKIPQSEADYLKQYNPKDYDAPLVTVDIGIFTLHEGELKVLLVQRSEFPEKGKWALPGGFVDVHRDTSPEATAMRKLQEKTGVKLPYLEQLATFGGAARDPRGWSLTVVYFALISYTIPRIKTARNDASAENIAWVEVNEALKRKLAFDHKLLLGEALERLRSKVLYTLMPAHLIETPFTLTALQRAYEVIMDREVEKKAFRRRLENADVLEETGDMVSEGPGRPAMLYRLKPGVIAFNFSRQLAQ